MDYMNFLAGGAAFGLVAGCWNYIKGFAWKLVSTLIQRVEIADNDLSRTLMGYLVTHYPRSRIYDRVYASAYEYIKTGEQTGEVPYEWFGQRGLILWNGCFPFIVNRSGASTTANGHCSSRSCAALWTLTESSPTPAWNETLVAGSSRT
jgi:hypothetical protein